MCVILDVNCFSEFKDKSNREMEPLRKWFDKENSKIAYAPTEKFRQEWNDSSKGKERQLTEWKRAGKLKEEDLEKVQREATRLLRQDLVSNDIHIIALARVAGIKVLVSRDQDLQKDFKNRKLVGGKVYNRVGHKHLLKPDLCP